MRGLLVMFGCSNFYFYFTSGVEGSGGLQNICVLTDFYRFADPYGLFFSASPFPGN